VRLQSLRRGVGWALAEKTFELAKEKRFEKIFTYVRADNIGSLAFHLRLGFTIIGTAKKQAKIRNSYVDEIMIEKFL